MKLFNKLLSLVLMLCLALPVCAAGLAEEALVPIPLKTVEATAEDADFYQQVLETELYNLKILRNFPMAYEQEGYEVFLSSANMLAKMDVEELSDAQKSTLEKLIGLQDALVQTKGYDEVMWPIWGESIPCHEDPSELNFTAQSYDNADFIPYLTPYTGE